MYILNPFQSDFSKVLKASVRIYPVIYSAGAVSQARSSSEMHCSGSHLRILLNRSVKLTDSSAEILGKGDIFLFIAYSIPNRRKVCSVLSKFADLADGKGFQMIFGLPRHAGSTYLKGKNQVLTVRTLCPELSQEKRCGAINTASMVGFEFRDVSEFQARCGIWRCRLL